jgi:hypothetical protein
MRYAGTVDPTIRAKEAALRLTSGYDSTTNLPFTRVSAMTNEAPPSENTSLVLYPNDSRTVALPNKFISNARLGYTDAASFPTGNGNSILARNENDARYYLNTTPLNLITEPADNIGFANKRLMNIADATNDRDAIPRQQADGRYYLNTTRLD